MGHVQILEIYLNGLLHSNITKEHHVVLNNCAPVLTIAILILKIGAGPPLQGGATIQQIIWRPLGCVSRDRTSWPAEHWTRIRMGCSI